MRTAEEILNTIWDSGRYVKVNHLTISMVISAINEARIEAIKECNEVAELHAKNECANYFKFIFKTNIADDSLYKSYLESKHKL